MRSLRFDSARFTDAEKVLLCSALTLPFALGWALQVASIAADPGAVDYVNVDFVTIELGLLLLVVVGHAFFVALSLGIRSRGARKSPWLVDSAIQFWILTASVALYTVGPFTTSFSTLLLAAPVIGYLLFDAPPMNRGIATLAVVNGAAVLLPALGLLPYAPFFAHVPFAEGRLSPEFTLAFGAPVVVVAIVTIAIHASLARTLRERTLELERQGRTDALTGLANRGAFFARLTEEVARARRRGDALSVLMIDVDHFKAVNDSFGHAEGDRVLAALAERFRVAVRAGDVPARYGGEEFTVLLPSTGAEDAAVVAERIRESVRSIHAGPAVAGHAITVSVGVAEFRGGESHDELLARADEALYESKRTGRDRVSIAPKHVG